MCRFLTYCLAVFLFALAVACGDENSASSEVDVTQSSSGTESSSGTDIPESSSVEAESSSGTVEVSSSSMEKESSSSEAESSSSIFVQRSRVIKDSSIYFEEENRLLDLRDSQEYRTVVIGEQTWMAQNLNYAYLESWNEEDSVSLCDKNELDSCSKYGRFYLFQAAVDAMGIFDDAAKGCFGYDFCEIQEPIRGVCPMGWHLPSRDEFALLVETAGGRRSAGEKLKSTEGWSTISGGIDGTDEYGFNIIPGGYVLRVRETTIETQDGPLSGEVLAGVPKGYVRFWTSSFDSSNDSWCPGVYFFQVFCSNNYMYEEPLYATKNTTNGFRIEDSANFVRCIKDAE